MIQVNKIHIHEFRGIRDLEIDFHSKNFAVCGPNGTGKSGIVDALEFALTGNISRLSGKGMGELSVKDHAPHVDSRNNPEKSRVILEVTFPSLKGKTATIERSVNSPQKPKVKPTATDVLAALHEISKHPEFALSRRNIIRYVISTPGDRATEVQALLQLDDVGKVRAALFKFANAASRQVAPLEAERQQSQTLLLQALGLSRWTDATVLASVNTHRSTLGLGPLPSITPTTSFRDGIAAGPIGTPPSSVPKIQAAAQIQSAKEVLARLFSSDTSARIATATSMLESLAANPVASGQATREVFLQTAIDLLVEEKCPVCDTPWKLDELRGIIQSKLKQFEQAANQRNELETTMQPLQTSLGEASVVMTALLPYGALLSPAIDVTSLRTFLKLAGQIRTQLQSLLPFEKTLEALKLITGFGEAPARALEALSAAVNSLPEPTKQDAAREFLVIAQERLEAYRGIATRAKRSKENAEMLTKVHDTYADVMNKVLVDIYKKVEDDFAKLYAFINKEDEEDFKAELTPSMNKLGFGVDFYGRGFFPPGAYHSEGHQDGMGLCLYLALMHHLLGDGFTFAVLDDVVMSVDVGHRRKVCDLLKEKFPHTQFVLTTHDEIWLRHMKAAGLVPDGSFIHFKNWNVDEGPTKWDSREIWDEIQAELDDGNIRRAAQVLRHYLEFIAAEICERLRAQVEFRSDGSFQLGDLMPNAVGQFSKLIKEGKNAAQSWGKTTEFDALNKLEEDFKKTLAASKVEEWQVNSAIHYNTWENLQKEDFVPVVDAFKALLQFFSCGAANCGSLLFVEPSRGSSRKMLRCSCATTNINLIRK